MSGRTTTIISPSERKKEKKIGGKVLGVAASKVTESHAIIDQSTQGVAAVLHSQKSDIQMGKSWDW